MSNLYQLDLKDVLKVIATAVLASVVMFLYSALNNGTTIDWAEVLRVAMASGLGYLMKNYLSDGEGKLLGRL